MSDKVTQNNFNANHPNHLVDVLATMAAHGFGEYVSDAVAVLPPDWRIRYDHSPRSIAIGVTYYVGMTDYEQSEIATRYGVSGSVVGRAYRTLANDLAQSP